MLMYLDSPLISAGDRVKFFRNSSNMARIGTKLCQNAFRTILNVWSFHAENFFSAKFSDQNFRFSLIWRGFGRSTAERTSKSASTSNFALDRLILRSVRPKNPEFGSNLGSPKNFHPIEGVRFSGGIISTASFHCFFGSFFRPFYLSLICSS